MYLQGNSEAADAKNRPMDMGGVGVGRRRWEEGREYHGNICTMCKIDNRWELPYDSRNSNQGSVTT